MRRLSWLASLVALTLFATLSCICTTPARAREHHWFNAGFCFRIKHFCHTSL
jgi:hypothetical protein